jgi:putative spermidine/putrescine transport system ATP-binding protein
VASDLSASPRPPAAPGSGAAAPEAAGPREAVAGTAACKLEVRGLRKTYGEFVALEGADLDLRDGEFLTLLGPSGSGKTTLLLAIAGLNEPDGGEIRIDGRLATYLPPYRRDIGMVFQNYALFPHMTVYDNIAFPLKMRRWAGERVRPAVERVLGIVQLPDLADRYPRQLSGGQQQRIALARALVYEPSVILMDEPLGALDKKMRDRLQLEIKQLHKELNIAVLYVTHDQEEALVMSDRICLMRDGRIEQLGPPDELYFRPRSVFAADFLGESNLLAGRCAATAATAAGRARVELAEGGVVECLGDAALEAGAPVRVMVRPEAMRLLREGERAENELTAILHDTVMSGGTTVDRFATASGEILMAKRLTDGLAARARPGEAAQLGFAADRAFAILEG